MARNLTRLTPPRIDWLKVKNRILSPKYDLSLVFVGDAEMKRINGRYRRKNKPTNVLAFGLGKNYGEIFIDLPFATREAKSAGRSARTHLLFLYIHALLHLKGFGHDNTKQSKIMNKMEQKWLEILS